MATNVIDSLMFGEDKYVIAPPYGICTTAAATAAKVVTIENFVLETGVEITVKFSVTNTASNPTLNVNGTGAKAIYYEGAAIAAGTLKANKVYKFSYNGTQYDFVGDIGISNTGVTADSYGPSANASPAHGASFVVPEITVDAKGRVTAATERTITLPSAQSSVSGNAGTADKLKTARKIALSGAATGTATAFDGSSDISIPVTELDATKLKGTVPLSSIPKGAQERLVPVTNETAMLALTSADIQNGDVVKLEDTGVMYYVVDDTKLGTAAAFSVFTAGAASSVPWTGITGKPTFANVATSGNYNDLSNKPTIPSAGTSTPSAASTKGSAGSASTYSKSDHSHPAQTSVTGNAGSATKLANARNIALTGDVSGSASFNGEADASINATLASTGVTAGSYGPSNDSAPGGKGTFIVPQVTVDAKGRVTSATSRTITMPDAPDVSAYVHVGSETEMTDPVGGTALTTLDIVDNLTSTNTDKVLSANQGKVLSDNIAAVESTANAASSGLSAKLNTSGGTMTGKLVAQNNTDYTVKQVRNIFISTSAPTSSDGDNGDIWLVYEA